MKSFHPLGLGLSLVIFLSFHGPLESAFLSSYHSRDLIAENMKNRQDSNRWPFGPQATALSTRLWRPPLNLFLLFQTEMKSRSAVKMNQLSDSTLQFSKRIKDAANKSYKTGSVSRVGSVNKLNKCYWNSSAYRLLLLNVVASCHLSFEWSKTRNFIESSSEYIFKIILNLLWFICCAWIPYNKTNLQKNSYLFIAFLIKMQFAHRSCYKFNVRISAQH